MKQTIPSTSEVRQRLLLLSYADVQALCERAALPVTTVWAIRSGATPNPRLETVRNLWPHLPRLRTIRGEARQGDAV